MTGWIVVASALLGGFLYFFIERKEYGCWSFEFSAWCLSFIFALMAGLISFVLLLILSSVLPSEEKLYREQEISALKDTTRLQGQAYLFTSIVNDTDYYHYISSTPRGINKEKAEIKNSYIIENNDIKPMVKIYRNEYKWSLAKWVYGKEAWGARIYEFYVPEGTVISNYYDVGVE